MEATAEPTAIMEATAEPTAIMEATAEPTVIKNPLDEFELLFYPFTLDYARIQWQSEQIAENVSALSHQTISGCMIYEQGPTELGGEFITTTIGGITYDIYQEFNVGLGRPSSDISNLYVARAGFDNPTSDIPLLIVTSPTNDWEQCKADAQSVLAMLHPATEVAPQATEVPEATPQATEAPQATPQATEAPQATPQATEAPQATPQATEAPQATPQASQTPETANTFPPPNYFRHVIGLVDEDTIQGIVSNGSTWEIGEVTLSPPLQAIWGSDYARATNRVLYWRYIPGGSGPSNLSVGTLHIFDVNTGQNQFILDQVHSAAWAPNGQDFAYIVAKPDTYELRWRTAGGEDKLLARDVPRQVSISPSGRMIAFTRESGYQGLATPPGLYVVEIESGAERLISNADRAGFGGSGQTPLWSPNEKTVLLTGARGTEEDITWAATDGSFSYALNSLLTEALHNQTNEEAETWCHRGTWLLNGNLLVDGVGPCGQFGPPNPTHLAIYELDPATGTIASARLLPIDPPTWIFSAWDVPAQSVLVASFDSVVSLSLSAAGP
ncbi:MAG: hypothetical protein ACPGWR_28840, partial [Ardenticatenaceae bacterium]